MAGTGLLWNQRQPPGAPTYRPFSARFKKSGWCRDPIWSSQKGGAMTIEQETGINRVRTTGQLADVVYE